VIERLGISEFIQATCNSILVPHSKPAPDPYAYICEKLEVEPKKSIAIEDSPAGVQSAVAAGLCVVGVGEAVANDPAVYPISSLEGMDLKKLRAIHLEWSERAKSYFLEQHKQSIS
jgi:beta-phosphoglucomutase-like phosphatase (HAD superfamily)